MRLDKKYLAKFIKFQEKYDTQQSLMTLGDDIASSFLAPVTKSDVKRFEKEQDEYGLDVALYNVVFNIASTILKDIGVTSIKTSSKTKSKK